MDGAAHQHLHHRLYDVVQARAQATARQDGRRHLQPAGREWRCGREARCAALHSIVQGTAALPLGAGRGRPAQLSAASQAGSCVGVAASCGDPGRTGAGAAGWACLLGVSVDGGARAGAHGVGRQRDARVGRRVVHAAGVGCPCAHGCARGRWLGGVGARPAPARCAAPPGAASERGTSRARTGASGRLAAQEVDADQVLVSHCAGGGGEGEDFCPSQAIQVRPLSRADLGMCLRARQARRRGLPKPPPMKSFTTKGESWGTSPARMSSSARYSAQRHQRGSALVHKAIIALG